MRIFLIMYTHHIPLHWFILLVTVIQVASLLIKYKPGRGEEVG